jgi:hypothetical protein
LLNFKCRLGRDFGITDITDFATIHVPAVQEFVHIEPDLVLIIPQKGFSPHSIGMFHCYLSQMLSIAGIVLKGPQGTLVALATTVVGVLAKMLVAASFHGLATNIAHGVATRRARHFVARVGFFEEGYVTVRALTHLGVG